MVCNDTIKQKVMSWSRKWHHHLELFHVYSVEKRQTELHNLRQGTQLSAPLRSRTSVFIHISIKASKFMSVCGMYYLATVSVWERVGVNNLARNHCYHDCDNHDTVVSNTTFMLHIIQCDDIYSHILHDCTIQSWRMIECNERNYTEISVFFQIL